MDNKVRYFQYLCKNIKILNKGYSKLAYKLFNTNVIFEPYVPNDDNRLNDGIELRSDFCYENKINSNKFLFLGDCNALELIIALARRCDDQTNIDARDHTDKWFYILINNLKLTEFNDDLYELSGGDKKIDSILNKLFGRSYKANGVGGFFPLTNAKRDQRKIEIWYQMLDYLNEFLEKEGKNESF